MDFTVEKLSSSWVRAQQLTSVQQDLKQVDYMGMTTDMWTSRSKDGYISVTAHHISPQFVMKHHFPGSHTALNIATMLWKSVEEDWGVDLHMQVPAFTTDNAKNVVNAISENLMLVAIPCAQHSLNLAVQDALAVKGVKTALARAKKLNTSTTLSLTMKNLR